MQRRFFLRLLPILTLIAIAFVSAISVEIGTVHVSAQSETVAAGQLQVLGKDGKPRIDCPLRHTDVKAEISGFLSRVVVTQEFRNPFTEKIEAVYTFPLPQNAAVDDMTMIVGSRTVRGKILRREEAQAVYDAAKAGGQTASLLDQERPNIFTQSVANILPGELIRITISYVETLRYEDGSYEFVFPMVVGPRYVPGVPVGAQGNGFAPDTNRVPDGSRITPAPVPAGMRGGHDISFDLTLDAGVPIDALNAKTHQVDIERTGDQRARIRLKDLATIPNKDFILRYDVAGKNMQDALLAHTSSKGGFFTLILQPPERVTSEDVMPKELVFVLDTSGSMSGFPIEKAKETMKLALDNLYPSDTFNLITFAGDEHILFPEPVPATPENLRKAQQFLESREGRGSTEMMKAIKASMDPSDAQDHVRIVCFMTDGYVGNEMEIIGEVQKHPNARVFAFGIGSSVNRYLLDNMAKHGRGEVEYVGLNDDGSAAARRFHERVRNPLLTDISIDWNGLPVTDVYPKRIPDLFGAKPVILSGRFSAVGQGVIKLRGKMGGRDFVREIVVDFSDSQKQHDVIATLWARNRIDDLMSEDLSGTQNGATREDLKQAIIQLGLDYRLMTQFTSFVAVEEMIVTDGGVPRRIDVPVEVPEGVNREAVFAAEGANNSPASFGKLPAGLAPSKAKARRASAGIGAGTGRGSGPGRDRNVGGGSLNVGGGGPGGGLASTKASPAPPSPAASTVFSAYKWEEIPLSAEEQKKAELQRKFHPSILALIDRLKDKTAGSPDEARFVRDGKAEVQIWLNDKSAATLKQLQELGFEVLLDPKTAKLVIGRLPIDKLALLMELKSVRYVAPQMASN